MRRPEDPGPGPNACTIACVLAFLSGAAGLIYEISWSRQVGLLFGHTARAAAVVLCSYFAGMAIGYLWAGRAARRWSRPLRGYCLAEFVVAGWAMVVPSIVSWIDEPAIASLVNSDNPGIQLFIRTVVVFTALLPATIGLGAALPFLVDFLAAGADETGRVNAAYASNLAGGVVGVVSATAVLLLMVGVRQSGYLAAAISGACGAIALGVDAAFGGRSPAAASQKDASHARRSVGSTHDGEIGRGRLLLLAAVSGFAVVALEVLYARLFALVFHNSTYTFGLVLVACLLALSTGAALARPLGDALGTRAIGDVCIMVSAAVPASVIAFVATTGLRYFTFGEGLGAYLSGAFGLVMLVVFPPMSLAGMLLPMAWRAAGGRSTASGVVGNLAAVNTIAGSAGAVVASFVALPQLGLWGAFGLIAVSYLVVPLAGSRGEGPRRSLVPAAAAVAIVVLGLLAPRRATGLEQGQELVEHWDSAYGWVDVIRDRLSGHTWMRRDAHHVMGSTEDLWQERWQGDLPLLLHPKPARTLFIGLGTGITAGAALAHRDVERVTVVELIPEVIEAARRFGPFNRNLLDDSRVTVVANDGRHFLAATDSRFDVIVSDIFVPWESQTGYLYTVEHYRVAQSPSRARWPVLPVASHLAAPCGRPAHDRRRLRVGLSPCERVVRKRQRDVRHRGADRQRLARSVGRGVARSSDGLRGRSARFGFHPGGLRGRQHTISLFGGMANVFAGGPSQHGRASARGVLRSAGPVQRGGAARPPTPPRPSPRSTTSPRR